HRVTLPISTWLSFPLTGVEMSLDTARTSACATTDGQTLSGLFLVKSSTPARVPQRFLADYFDDGGFERLAFVLGLGGEACKLNGEAPDVDAVPRGIALIGGMRPLQEIGDVIQNAIFGERQVLLEDEILFVAVGE